MVDGVSIFVFLFLALRGPVEIMLVIGAYVLVDRVFLFIFRSFYVVL